ncbi:MAG: 2Fe-2S iron-sulfur cluster-binding protein [Actinomycetes bacterium]
MSDHVSFELDGVEVSVAPDAGETLLTVLRERLGVTDVKDGCAPQGQCGCCTVLVDGDARVACVTPVARVAGRRVTTVWGLEPGWRDDAAAALVATGGSQCGFCTPGIIVRAAAATAKGRGDGAGLGRALAAHVCRCTGWQTIVEAFTDLRDGVVPGPRDLDRAAERARLEGGVAQRVDRAVPLGGAEFADDAAPRDALVAVLRPAGSEAPAEIVDGTAWVIGPDLATARRTAGTVQGRRTTVDDRPPFPAPATPIGGYALATGWVDPAYLEPDASWCVPGGEPASARGNGGGFGGKAASIAPAAARALADRLERPVRVVLSREDVVRRAPKRAPIAATATFDGRVVRIDGVCAAGGEESLAAAAAVASPYGIGIEADWRPAVIPGPAVSGALRAAGSAETAVLVEGALTAAGADRLGLVAAGRAAAVLLDTCVANAEGALAGARVEVDATSGCIEGVQVRVAAGDPLDDVVLRSYAIGAAHMALGWVLTEGLAVDPETGEPLDLTIRSLGIIRAQAVPPIEVGIVDESGPPRARASDAVFAAVAAATVLGLLRADGVAPGTFPARDTRAARALRR